MEVYFNEKCLTEEVEIKDALAFFGNSILPLSHSGIKIWTCTQELYHWYLKSEPFLDLPAKNFLMGIFAKIGECQENKERFYYHHFRHQDFNLSVSENISDSSLATAANKVLLNHLIAVLNLPKSTYCERPHLPILKASHDSTIKDELANLPCFEDAISIKRFALSHEKVRPLISDSGLFEEFNKEYKAFVGHFDYENWRPKCFSKGSTLMPECAFPAIINDTLKKVLSELFIKKEAFRTTASKYIEVGGIVLEIHGYSKNRNLSGHYHHDIYEGGSGNSKLIISIDSENGAFEVIDNTGTHIGVYGYDGRYIKHYTKQSDIDSHSFKNIPKEMFIYK
jgi:hypothetical protein